MRMMVPVFTRRPSRWILIFLTSVSGTAYIGQFDSKVNYLNHERSEKQNSSIESPIYTVPELMRIVRVVGDHVPLKVRFSFIYESIAEMALFSTSRPVNLCTC